MAQREQIENRILMGGGRGDPNFDGTVPDPHVVEDSEVGPPPEECTGCSRRITTHQVIFCPKCRQMELDAMNKNFEKAIAQLEREHADHVKKIREDMKGGGIDIGGLKAAIIAQVKAELKPE